MPLPARLLAFALGALSLALLPRTAAADGVQVQGTATYTGGNLAGGACLYYNYTLPPGLYGTAIDLSHGTPYQCGTCLRIIGSLGTIVAMVRLFFVPFLSTPSALPPCGFSQAQEKLR
jgi:hypothetical protein